MSRLPDDIIEMLGQYADMNPVITDYQKWTVVKTRIQTNAAQPNSKCIDILYNAYINNFFNEPKDTNNVDKTYLLVKQLCEEQFITDELFLDEILRGIDDLNFCKLAEYALCSQNESFIGYFSLKVINIKPELNFSSNKVFILHSSLENIIHPDFTNKYNHPQNPSHDNVLADIYVDIVCSLYYYILGMYDKIPCHDNGKFVPSDENRVGYAIFINKLFAYVELKKEEQMNILESINDTERYSLHFITNVYNQKDRWLWNELVSYRNSEYPQIPKIVCNILFITDKFVEFYYDCDLVLPKIRILPFLNVNIDELLEILSTFAENVHYTDHNIRKSIVVSKYMSRISALAFISKYDYVNKHRDDFFKAYALQKEALDECIVDSSHEIIRTIRDIFFVKSVLTYISYNNDDMEYFINIFKYITSDFEYIENVVLLFKKGLLSICNENIRELIDKIEITNFTETYYTMLWWASKFVKISSYLDIVNYMNKGKSHIWHSQSFMRLKDNLLKTVSLEDSIECYKLIYYYMEDIFNQISTPEQKLLNDPSNHHNLDKHVKYKMMYLRGMYKQSIN